MTLEQIPTSVLSDVAPQRVVMRSSIHAIDRAAYLAGPAFTVRVYPGDNRSLHEALEQAEPASVIVIDGGGFPERSLWGDLMSRRAKLRGIAGLVADGAVRDSTAVSELDFPMFAVGTVPLAPRNRHPGAVGTMIRCGGLLVNPGDIIHADRDGVVAIPRLIYEEVLKRARHRLRREDEIRERLRAGNSLSSCLHLLHE
jgi:4-hydroxy-4-methyl-2-oxoglutarate aldolase